MGFVKNLKVPRPVGNFLYWSSIISLVFLEINIIFLMFLLFYPVPIQKIERIISDMTCSYGVKQYEYSIAEPELDVNDTQLVIDYAWELDVKVGFPLFVYNKNSPNKIYLLRTMKEGYSLLSFLGFNETIGLTYCTQPCCGVNNYKVEFAEKEFLYDPIKTKLLIWHEFGHVVGLNHDDSQPDIMNSTILSDSKFTQAVEDRYISKLKERMGIK